MSELTLKELSNRPWLRERLIAAGLSDQAVEGKASLFVRLSEALIGRSGSPTAAATACFVPGRIEVLGKHTDYGGGRSLLVAVERGFCVVALPRSDSIVTMLDAIDGEGVRFPIDTEITPTVGHWSNYPMTVARRVARNFTGPLQGADMAFASDLPRAAGMSSSSAMVVATFLTLSAANRFAQRDEYTTHIHGPEDLAGYLGTVENGMSFGALVGDRGVGTFGGSEDHTAMLCARPGNLSQYAYCPVRFERLVKLPDDHVFVVAVSGVVAEKTGDAMEKYNRVSELARAVVELWCRATGRDDPHLAALLASSPGSVDRIRNVLSRSTHSKFTPTELLDRFEHFLTESEEIIPSVADELSGPQLDRFGELVDRSQRLGVEQLGNQVPETVYLAASARELGAAAASSFGAGFGGSVWALVSTDQADKLSQQWAASYAKEFPEAAERSSIFLTHSGPACFQLD